MDWKTTVQKAKNKNADAWGQLFENTQSMVYFTCVKLVHDTQAAQDIAQEVYISAMEHIGSLEQEEAFPGWIKRIAVNLSKNYLIKKKPMLFSEDEQETVFGNIAEVNEDFLPEEYAQKKETCRIITGIVDSLPEKQRMCVMLYYFDELSVSEIANIMGVSENTVKSRLNYARSAIKKEVEALEKKGTKLYCAGLPVLALILRSASTEYTLPPETAAAITAGFTAASSAAAAATTAAAGSSAGTTSAAAVSSAGVLAKLAALPPVTKLIAGILAAVISIGGVAAGITLSRESSDTGNSGKVHAGDFFDPASKPEPERGKSGEDMSAKNEAVRQQLEEYWTNNCQTDSSRYFFADITHDGIDEMFSVVIDFPYGDYTVYTVSDGQPVSLFTDGSAEMTNWRYSHYMIVLEGELYIIRSGYFGRQGYPLVMYEVFSLSEDGQKIILKEDSYEGQEALDKEQEMSGIIREYEQKGVMILGFESIDLSFGTWEQQVLDSMVEEK